MPYVEYEGPTSRSDTTSTIYVDGVRLDKGKPVEVEDALAKELTSGDSERLKGHKFSSVTKKEAEAEASEPSSSTQKKTQGDTGGQGGTSSPTR